MDAILLHNCLLEFLGTFVLLLLGDGVVANVVLNKNKGQNGGWIVITLGWGLAVMSGVFIAHDAGAHLNPAVSLGLATAGLFPWAAVIPYSIAQCLGGFLGASVVYIMYKDHYDATSDNPTAVLDTFCTRPEIEGHQIRNFFVEAIATAVLVVMIISIGTYAEIGGQAAVNPGAVQAWPITMVIVSIGVSLGGTTGYAINPARDLPPRIAHAVLPIKNKRDSNWGYAWVPVFGPLAGCVIAALICQGMGFC